MKLTYREWGRYAAYRTHNIDTNELRKYLEENFVDSDIKDLSDDTIANILQYASDWEDSMIYDKETGEAYRLTDIIIDWVGDMIYAEAPDWEIYDTDVYDSELIEVDN